MAQYTGYKQASIVYVVDRRTGQPLDINGNRTAESGRKQAIFVLEGFPNPNPTLYEIKGTFQEGAIVMGQPTSVKDTDECEQGATVPWVLVGGTWHMANTWVNTETWNFL